MAASPEVGGGGGAATKWPAYVRMCRPGNLPASLLFVVGGAMAATHDLRSAVRWPVLLAAATTGLVTTSSCVVNDYFDYRIGTDEGDEGNLLSKGELDVEEVKAFVSKMYSALLYLVCLAPTAPIRLLLMAGSVSTFVYTKRLKPYTWFKNGAVAFICAMAPAVGGMAAALDPVTGRVPLGQHAFSAFALQGSTLLGLTVSSFPCSFPAVASCAAVVVIFFIFFFLTPSSLLTRCMLASSIAWHQRRQTKRRDTQKAALFLGVMHREVLMDITDVRGDAATGIRTVPVVFGVRRAALVAAILAGAQVAAVAATAVATAA